jgi:hypothetical protein
MLSWEEFERERLDLAGAGRGLLYQFGGVGLAFLATVRRDGGPRVHPMCPLVERGGLFAFLVPSPKRADLIRDRRYAMHSFPSPVNEDAFYLAGVAEARPEADLREAVAAVWFRERELDAPPPGFDEELLFEFRIDACLLTRTTGHGDYSPRHTVWTAG